MGNPLPDEMLPLPSAREALRQAVERAVHEEWHGAAVWLGIARELRQGTRPSIWSDAAGLPEAEELMIGHGDEAAQHVGQLFGQHRVDVDDHLRPLRQPPADPAATAVIDPGETSRITLEDGHLQRCGNCSHRIEWLTPGPDATATGRMPHWVHALTQQEVCPVSAPDQPHTYATPRVDARG